MVYYYIRSTNWYTITYEVLSHWYTITLYYTITYEALSHALPARVCSKPERPARTGKVMPVMLG